MCPRCKKKIDWRNNIPLLSFFILKGKCARCGKKISWQYPVVEFLTGVLFVWWWLIGREFFQLAGLPWMVMQPVFWLLIGMGLLVVLVADWRFGVIPDGVNLFLFSVILIYRLALVGGGKMELEDFTKAILSAGGLTVFFYLLWRGTKGRGFGLGDVKLAPALGILLGWPKVTVGIFLAFIIGSVAGLMLIALGRKKFKQTIAFGPFLVVGTVMALWWGGKIWSFYFGLM